MANPFHFANGADAHSIEELHAILKKIPDKDVQEHVTQGHFAAWVRHELENPKLADRLNHCSTVQQVKDVLRIETAPKQEPKKEPVKQKPIKSFREPIKDLGKSSSEENPFAQRPKPIITNKQPPAKESTVQKYNAKEFVLGLMIGIVLGVLIMSLLNAI